MDDNKSTHNNIVPSDQGLGTLTPTANHNMDLAHVGDPVEGHGSSRGAQLDLPSTANPSLEVTTAVPKPPAEVKGHRGGLVTLKELTELYPIKLGTLYTLIKTDPTFPYKNVGLKKKFVVNLVEFEKWMDARTNQQQRAAANIPSAEQLLGRFNK